MTVGGSLGTPGTIGVEMQDNGGYDGGDGDPGDGRPAAGHGGEIVLERTASTGSAADADLAV